MKKYKFKFKGRQLRAIGKFYPITYKCEATTLGEAIWLLYEKYDCIQLTSLWENVQMLDPENFNNTKITKPKEIT